MASGGMRDAGPDLLLPRSAVRSGAVGTQEVARLLAAASADFPRYEVLKDLTDELIDLSLNYRQSGHPGGSRSKVHMLLSLLLSGAMRWDLRRPWLRFSDRFVLSAGHTVPLVYATLALLNEGLRERHRRSGEERYAFPDGGRWALTWEHLLDLRHRGGLPGHAEMSGRTLFLKFNTGPSGHGTAPAAGEALALRLAGAGEVKVFAVEGEGGLTPGGSHEARATAFGLGLSNLVFLLDWNDFGIDPRPLSSVVSGTPSDWFAPYGWRVVGADRGSEWGDVTRAVLDAAVGENPLETPTVAWFKTRKGRGYGKYDASSHGTPWPLNAPQFWEVRQGFMEKYGVEYRGAGQPAPEDPAARREQARANLDVALSVLRRDGELVEWLSDRLVELGDQVPERIPEARHVGGSRVFADKRIFDVREYPAALWKKPGEKAPNRAALGAWGAYVNSLALKEHGRPLFVAASADLAESTNLAGFAAGFGDLPGAGWYERASNPRGALLPTEITEFGNAGLIAGLATVNLADDPFSQFDGFWGACSTYGSFSYLKYGPMRLFSQLAQDCELRVGKVLWVAGHSGPETAEDSRTHFGIYEPGVTQLFPEGQVIDLHPWEYNEVPVVLAAALSAPAPVVALHLTRPAVEIPDRERLRMPSHLEAARGAYLIRDYRQGLPRGGVVLIRGTVPTANLVSLLPELDRLGLNVKVVAAISPQLFRLQAPEYRAAVLGPGDLLDSMAITNGSLRMMRDWADHPLFEEYSLFPDWDHRWRTGGTVEEVMQEAHLDSAHILEALDRFAKERGARLERLAQLLEAAREG
jgi:transketolase